MSLIYFVKIFDVNGHNITYSNKNIGLDCYFYSKCINFYFGSRKVGKSVEVFWTRFLLRCFIPVLFSVKLWSHFSNVTLM